MDNAGVVKADLGVDLPAHEETYAGFVSLTENAVVHVINIILLLLIWGIEGHPFVALIGFVLNIVASAASGALGLSWRLPAVVFGLLGVLAIIL